MSRLSPAEKPAQATPSGPEIDGGSGVPMVRGGGLRGFLELDRRDLALLVLLFVFSFALRYASPFFPNVLSSPGPATPVTAWGVGYPYNSGECSDVPLQPSARADSHVCGFVFDEIYFPVDAAKDLHQPPESYFDPEPPLTKLLMSIPIAAMGFNTWSWRASTVLFGSLLVVVMYLIALRLRRDRFFATCAALFVSLDGLAFVESRIGVIDIIAIFFVALFYYAFLLHWQARTKRQWRITLLVMASVCGLAFGAKITAIAPLAIAAALIIARGVAPYLAGLWPALRRLSGPRRQETILWRQAAGSGAVLHYAIAILIAAAIFCTCFSRYLSTAHDDVYIFTSCTISSGLVGSPEKLQEPVVPAATVPLLGPWLKSVGVQAVPNPGRALYNIKEITAAGLRYHETECHSHPYASRWYSWPVMAHPVLFYLNQTSVNGGSDSTVATITDMGNPAVWWPALLALLWLAWRMTRGPLWWRIALPALGTGSLLAMSLTFLSAIRYQSSSAPGKLLTSQQFTALTHQIPGFQDEAARVSPGAIFWVGFAGVALFCVGTVLSAVISRRFVPSFIVLGYITSWMMWVPGNERRVLFFYHALGMLLFAALALAYALAALRNNGFGFWRWLTGEKPTFGVEGGAASRGLSLVPLAWAAVACVVLSFIFFYPVWTGTMLRNADHQARLWVNTP